MAKITKDFQCSAHGSQRKASQYIVELHTACLSSTLAPNIIQQMKLKRKMPGVLSVRCIVPGLSKTRKRSSPILDHFATKSKESAIYLTMNAVSSTSACIAIAQIDAILYRAVGVHVSAVVQHVPCAVARFLFCHHSKVAEVHAPARHVLLDRPNQAALTFSRTLPLQRPSLTLLLIVQRMFEQGGVNARSLGLAKTLVWDYIGGPTHDLTHKIQVVSELLSDVIVRKCALFNYAPILSLRFSKGQPTALELVEQCGVGVWALWGRSGYPFYRVAFAGEGDLHVCGTASVVSVALERLRAIRTSEYPDTIVIREVDWLLGNPPPFRSIDFESYTKRMAIHWKLAFGDAEAQEILDWGEKLDCCLTSGTGAGKGKPRDRTALKRIVKRCGLLVVVKFGWQTLERIGIIGQAKAVNEFLQLLAPIRVGDHVQVSWAGQEWKAIVSECQPTLKSTWYMLTDPAGYWGPWWAEDCLVSRLAPWPVAQPQPYTSNISCESNTHFGMAAGSSSQFFDGSRSGDMTEIVVHGNTGEVPAQISEAEAAEFVSIQQADFTERLVLCTSMEVPKEEPLEELKQPKTVVLLLQFNRCPRPAFEALRTGAPLRKCREALDAEGLAWILPSGALVFVEPAHYRMVMHALNGKTLRTSHVVVLEDLEYLVEESIISIMGIGKGAWCKSRISLSDLMHDMSDATCGSPRDSDGDEDRDQSLQMDTLASDNSNLYERLSIVRTLFTIPAPLSASDSVIQSTTEANPRNGKNPRRCIATISDNDGDSHEHHNLL